MEVLAPATAPAIRIGERFLELLGRLEPPRNQGWLADRAGVERSTISRIVNGDRSPSVETLQLVAVVFGVSIGELVKDTDAAVRLREAADLVPRKHYEEAIGKVLTFERRANDAEAAVRDLKRSLTLANESARSAVSEQERLKSVNGRISEALTERAREVERLNETVARYVVELSRAVAEVGTLRGQVQDLAQAVETGKRTGRVTAILAGVAAVTGIMTAATAFGANDANDDEENVD